MRTPDPASEIPEEALTAELFWFSGSKSRRRANSEPTDMAVVILRPPPERGAAIVRIVAVADDGNQTKIWPLVLPFGAEPVLVPIPPGAWFESARLRLDVQLVPEQGQVRKLASAYLASEIPRAAARTKLFFDAERGEVTARHAGGPRPETLCAYTFDIDSDGIVGPAQPLTEPAGRQLSFEVVGVARPENNVWIERHWQRFGETQLQAAHARNAFPLDIDIRFRRNPTGAQTGALPLNLSAFHVPKLARTRKRRALPHWLSAFRGEVPDYVKLPARRLRGTFEGVGFALRAPRPGDLVVIESQGEDLAIMLPDGGELAPETIDGSAERSAIVLEVTESLGLRRFGDGTQALEVLLDFHPGFDPNARVDRQIRALGRRFRATIAPDREDLDEAVKQLEVVAGSADEFVLCLMRLSRLGKDSSSSAARQVLNLLLPEGATSSASTRRCLSPLSVLAEMDGSVRTRLLTLDRTTNGGIWADDPLHAAFDLFFPDDDGAAGASRWLDAEIIGAKDPATKAEAKAVPVLFALRGTRRYADDLFRLSAALSIEDALSDTLETELTELREAFLATDDAAAVRLNVLRWATEAYRSELETRLLAGDVPADDVLAGRALYEIAERLQPSPPGGRKHGGLLTMRSLRDWRDIVELPELLAGVQSLSQQLRSNSDPAVRAVPGFSEHGPPIPGAQGTVVELSVDRLTERAKALNPFYAELVEAAKSEGWPQAVRRALAAVLDSAQTLKEWDSELDRELSKRRWQDNTRHEIKHIDGLLRKEPEGVAKSLEAAQAVAEAASAARQDRQEKKDRTDRIAAALLATIDRMIKKKTGVLAGFVGRRRAISMPDIPAEDHPSERLATHWAVTDVFMMVGKTVRDYLKDVIELSNKVLPAVSDSKVGDGLAHRRDTIGTQISRLLARTPQGLATDSSEMAKAFIELNTLKRDLEEASRKTDTRNN